MRGERTKKEGIKQFFGGLLKKQTDAIDFLTGKKETAWLRQEGSKLPSKSRETGEKTNQRAEKEGEIFKEKRKDCKKKEALEKALDPMS